MFIWRRIWLHCIFFVSKDWLHAFLTYLYLQRLTTVICNIGLFCSKAFGHCNSNNNGGYIFKKKERERSRAIMGRDSKESLCSLRLTRPQVASSNKTIALQEETFDVFA